MFLLAFSSGVGAASKLEKIQADLNRGISIILDGAMWKPKDASGKEVAPISYKGSTYLPLRSVSEATGVSVNWNNAKQQISITTKETPATGKKLSFNSETVKHIKWGNNTNGITRNKEDLLFGGTQYNAAFMVSGVSNAGQGVGFSVQQGAKRLEVLIGYKNDKEYEGKYTITDRADQTLATGTLMSGEVETNTIDLPPGVTDLYIEFEGEPWGSGLGFLIWDESYLEF